MAVGKMGMHVVLSGNPVRGIKFYGPFTTGAEAEEWGEANRTEWWSAPLAEPVPRMGEVRR